MKKVLISSLLMMAGLVLGGCAHRDQHDLKAAHMAPVDNSSYQSGHSSKLGHRY